MWMWSPTGHGSALSQCIAVAEKPKSIVAGGKIGSKKLVAAA